MSSVSRENGPEKNGQPRVYTPEELEFIEAVRAYQERTGRKYPSWSEILGVVKEAGYTR